jgi:hypothetical protein
MQFMNLSEDYSLPRNLENYLTENTLHAERDNKER